MHLSDRVDRMQEAATLRMAQMARDLRDQGKDGSYLRTIREQPAVGVSGTEMFESLCRSLVHASNGYMAVDFL